MNKYSNIEIKAVKDEDRVVEFIATKEVVDYDGDVVVVDGIDTTKILKGNKSFLWGHRQNDPPIGKILSLKKDGDILIGKAQMTSEEEYSFGFTIYKLIKGGYINNISIGFLPDYDSITFKEDRATKKQIRHINKSTLLEISAVNIGANPKTSISAKSFSDAANKAWEDQTIDGEELKAIQDELDKVVDIQPISSDVIDKQLEVLQTELDELKKYVSFLEKELEDKDTEDPYETIIQELQEDEDTYKELVEELQ
jgi:HK97 family phage prohead protease